MKLNTLNQWLTLGANLGVLAGIAVLIYEVNQTHLAIRAQMAQSRADAAMNLAIVRISTPGFAEAITAVDSGSLSDADQYRLSQHTFLMWRHLENLHYQVLLGVLEVEQARLEQVAHAVLKDAPHDWWDWQSQRQMDPELRNLMERVRAEISATKEHLGPE